MALEPDQDEPAPQPRPGARERPLSVSQVVHGANNVLDRTVGTIWVEGETVSVTRPSSGHVYFALMDRKAQLRAVMWRTDARRLKFQIEDGLTLRCRGRLGIFERDGKLQFYVQHAEPAGLGAEALAFEQLKAKLAAEGLFDAARKRPLPALPRRIGVVTSRSGAAVRDIIRAVQRRFPVPILVADCAVQGASAPRQIAHAITSICMTDVDVVIVGRGGGSASDLSAFNAEAVVRAVAACKVPIISAVGHEIDTTLTDLAADRRAATPTMAGEMAVPVLTDLQALLRKEERRLDRELHIRLRDAGQEIDQLAGRAQARLNAALHARRRRLDDLGGRLQALHPQAQILARRAQLRDLEARADRVVSRRTQVAHRALADLGGRLAALSPLRVLERGYAIARAGEHVVTGAAQLAPGDTVEVRLARGRIEATVTA
ncbi:MAG TPA: exodeoxyribonuclease VII large subunit, partial [Kofleriaceae bacterium]|nr:exodeoxyribonuclease VII large subunit [Kofleriaceae bacterium]